MIRPAPHALTLVAVLLAACSSGSSDPTPPTGGGAAAIDAGTPEQKPAAILQRTTGTVTLTRKGAATPATQGPLFDGDVVETAAESNAVLRFPDGRELELGENGRMEIGTEADGLVLNVGQGIVVSRVGGSTGETMQLSLDTPYGLVRVGKGGVSVNVGSDEALIDVLAGDVTLVGREGGPLSLAAGAEGSLTKSGASRKVRLEPLAIVLSRGGGRVEVKKKDGKAFAPVNPKKPPTLAAGDSLRVTGGTATLTPDKSDAKVTLVSGTEVGIGESVTKSGAEDLALEVKKGQLQLALPFGKKRTIRPGEGLALTAEQGGQLTVVKGKNGLELNSIVGDVVVETEGGQKVTVKGGQTATLTRAGIEPHDVAREALQLPTRQGLKLLHPGAERVALVWPGDDDKAYRVILASDAAFEKPFVDGIIRQPSFNTVAPARGALFWKILEGETEIGKGSVVIAAERIGDELDGITNVVPAGPEKTVIYFQDKPPALTFTWKTPDKPVTEYLLKIYKAGNLAAPLLERRTTATSAQLPHGSVPEGTYQWDVTWLDAKGTPLGTAGKMNQLELQYDNAVRALIIKAPRNGDAAAQRVAVSGIA
ncbi:MAG: FecR domain-containing protein, partial [Myxococcales bacterium]|nr:FecR domain-containing protein [Myxococcales bacterium]